MIIFRGEPVEIEEVDGDSADDLYIAKAYWTKTGESLTDDEAHDLAAERPDVLSEKWMDMMIMKAEDRADMLADR